MSYLDKIAVSIISVFILLIQTSLSLAKGYLNNVNNQFEKSNYQKIIENRPHFIDSQQEQNIHYAQSTNYTAYYNSQFKFTVDYPVDFLFPQGDFNNDGGQLFLSKDEDVVMIANGYYNTNSEQIDDLYRISSREKLITEQSIRIVTYKARGNNWFVVSGYEDGIIFYTRTIVRNDIVCQFTIWYKESDKIKLDPIVTRISRSFRRYR